MVGVLLVAGLIGLFVSDRANRRFVDESRQQIAALQTARAADARASDDPLAVLPLLDAARDLPGGEAERARAADAVVGEARPRSAREARAAKSQRVYQRLLAPDACCRSSCSAWRSELRRGDATMPRTQYEVLRAYLMLGDPTHFDAGALRRLGDARLAARPAAERERRAARRASNQHLEALFRRGQFDSNLPLDQNLIAQARATLESRAARAAPLDGRIQQQLAQLQLPDFSIAKAAGPSGLLVFVRKSGAPLTQGVDGAYTRAGFEAFVRLREVALADLSQGRLGARPRGDEAGSPPATDELRAALTRLYCEETIRQWDGLLADVGVVPFSAPDQGARIANLLGRRELAVARPDSGRRARDDVRPGARADTGQARRAASRASAGARAAGAARRRAPAPRSSIRIFSRCTIWPGAALDDADRRVQGCRRHAARPTTPRASSRCRCRRPASLDRLKLLAQNAPAPLASVLQGVAGNADTVQLQSQRAQLRALWAASVAPAVQAGARRALSAREDVDARRRAGRLRAHPRRRAVSSTTSSRRTCRIAWTPRARVWKWRPEAQSLGIPDDVPVNSRTRRMLRDAIVPRRRPRCLGALHGEGRVARSVAQALRARYRRPATHRDQRRAERHRRVPVAERQRHGAGARRNRSGATARRRARTGRGRCFISSMPRASSSPVRPITSTCRSMAAACRSQLVANSVDNPFRAGVLDRFRCPPRYET